MTDYTDTGLGQVVINKIKKTKFEEITPETNQVYLINPEYTGNKVPLTSADGNLTESSVTNTELGCLTGVTSAIQTQLDGKATTEQGAKADTALQASDILDSVSSTATNKALSANQGKNLNDRIDGLSARGRYLSDWNCATGLPTTNPTTSPYTYQAGDYFIVKYISVNTNYRPNGTTYTTGVASTTVETQTVAVGDTYRFDSTNWILEVNTERTITIANVSGLQDALDGKYSTSNPSGYITNSALNNRVSFTNNTVVVAGTSKVVSKTNPECLFANNGLIMGGTAASAGLVSRGVCGVTTPDSTGACSKDNLYLNYDSNDTNNPNGRGVVINAGYVGTNLGNGMYSYCATRGDVVKNWVEAKGYVTSSYHDSTKADVNDLGTLAYADAITNGDISGTINQDKITNLTTDLGNKVTKNNAITGATKCKITYDSKGLVTAGADLSASDIPNLSLSKITDVTATASEVNVLDGITATTTELNYCDGVTSNIQTQLNGKQGTLPTLESGKYLTNNGTTLSWASVDALPSQAGQSGKYLTTDGTTASWSSVPSDSTKAGLSANNTFTGTNTFNNTITGSISGNAATATKATQDGDGNTISSTYVKLNGSNLQSGTGSGKVRCVTNTSISGNNWYRIWSDGWKEQGGVSSSTTSITLNTSFSNTSYTCLIAGGGHTGSGADITPYITEKTTTTVTVKPDRTTTFNWYACGY